MNDNIPAMFTKTLQSELVVGEHVVWHGRPLPFHRLLASARAFIFAGLFTVMFLAAWPVGRTFDGLIFLFPDADWGLFQIFFLLLATWAFLQPFWAWWVARRTIYIVTDRRALIVEVPCWHTVRSFADERLMDFMRREKRRGRGDIVFECRVTRHKGSIDVQETGFFDLIGASKVEQLLRSAYFSLSRA